MVEMSTSMSKRRFHPNNELADPILAEGLESEPEVSAFEQLDV